MKEHIDLCDANRKLINDLKKSSVIVRNPVVNRFRTFINVLGYKQLSDLDELSDDSGGIIACIARDAIFDSYIVWAWQFCSLKCRLLPMMDNYDIFYVIKDSVKDALSDEHSPANQAVCQANYQFVKL